MLKLLAVGCVIFVLYYFATLTYHDKQVCADFKDAKTKLIKLIDERELQPPSPAELK